MNDCMCVRVCVNHGVFKTFIQRDLPMDLPVWRRAHATQQDPTRASHPARTKAALSHTFQTICVCVNGIFHRDLRCGLSLRRPCLGLWRRHPPCTRLRGIRRRLHALLLVIHAAWLTQIRRKPTHFAQRPSWRCLSRGAHMDLLWSSHTGCRIQPHLPSSQFCSSRYLRVAFSSLDCHHRLRKHPMIPCLLPIRTRCSGHHRHPLRCGLRARRCERERSSACGSS